MTNKRFLFLQSVASPFFDHLANALLAKNHAVYKINFCGGDCLYWRKKSAWNFTAPLENLPSFIEEKFLQFQFTDIILFGDMRPVHIPAISIAKHYQAKIWVFEEGYIRPNWLTLEMNGVNANSLLPKQPEYYLTQAKQLPNYHDGLDTDYSLMTRFFHDLKYNVARYRLAFRFPHYQLHRPQSVLTEYWGWIKRIPLQKTIGEFHAKKIYQQLIENKQGFFLFPLQLHYDAQIIHHSPFNSIEEAITMTLKSFAHYANKDDVIVFKNHPLDIGIVNYRAFIRRLQQQLKLDDRVIFIDGGHLPSLLEHCKGTITINSTTGISALLHHCPVIALGKAIYNIEGLTFQASLDEFWTQAQPPNSVLFQSFRNTVIYHSQINGNFYTQKGIKMTVTHSIERILNEHS